MKCMPQLMPHEMKVESTSTTLGKLSDEQLQAMVHELDERIAAMLRGEDTKVINGKTGDPTALLQPAKPDTPWRPRRTRKAARALRAMTGGCETNNRSLPSPGEEPLK